MLVHIKLLSDTILGSGQSIPGGEDICIQHDKEGFPYYSGSTLRGILREELLHYLAWIGEDGAAARIESLFGKEDMLYHHADRTLLITDFTVPENVKKMIKSTAKNKDAVLDAFTYLRRFTSIHDNGTAKEGSLRTARCLMQDISLYGEIICPDNQSDQELIANGLRCIKWIGTMRNRGFGKVKIQICADRRSLHPNQQQMDRACAYPAAKEDKKTAGDPKERICLEYRIHTLQPLRIADKSAIQNGQTQSLHYIPGTTIRGAVIKRLVQEELFEHHKKTLFSSQTSYFNAYPVYSAEDPRQGEALFVLPTPMGFIESKASRGALKNIFTDGRPSSAYKRADLSEFAHIQADTIQCMAVETGEKLGIGIDINLEGKKIFMEDYLSKGQTFGGYILLSDAGLAEDILRCMHNRIVYLGSNKSSGFGKCNLTIRQSPSMPYQRYAKQDSADREVYMMLLSDMALVNENGEICGLEQGLGHIQKKLGVTGLRLLGGASAIHKNSGINHTWGLRTPEIPMYRAGSVFRFAYQGSASVEAMRMLEMEGIGVRRNEGCGRILFVDFIPNIRKKEKVSNPAAAYDLTALEADCRGADAEMIKAVAKRYFQNKIRRLTHKHIVEQKLNFSLTGSQMGHLQALCTVLKHQPQDAEREINDYLEKAVFKDDKKKRHTNQSTRHALREYVDAFFQKSLIDILKMPANTLIMGIAPNLLLSAQEELSVKLDLLDKMIRYYGREKKAEWQKNVNTTKS